MSVFALLKFATLFAIANGGAAARFTQAETAPNRRAGFTSLAQEYQMFVTPICAPIVAAAYRNANVTRDRTFIESLAGTELQKRYRDAVRAWSDKERGIVRHCDGPPPPPPAPGSSQPPLSPRAMAIKRVQDRLQGETASVTAHFDEGDRIFDRLIALRDEIMRER